MGHKSQSVQIWSVAHADESRDGQPAMGSWFSGGPIRLRSPSIARRVQVETGVCFTSFEVPDRGTAISPSVWFIRRRFVSQATGQSQGKVGQRAKQLQAMQGRLRCDTEIWDVRGDV